MDPFRILFAYQYLVLGGVEVLLRGRLEELARRGIEARVVFLREGEGEALFADLRDRIHIPREAEDLERMIAEYQPDIISTIDTPAIIAAARRAAPQARIVYEVHTTYPENQRVLFDRELLSQISGVIVPSPSQQSSVSEKLALRLPVRIAPNFLPPDLEAPFTPPAPPASRPIVLWVGRLDELKNWRAFLELARQVATKTEAEFRLVGGNIHDANEQDELRRMIKAYGLSERFQWLPRVLRDEMRQIYQAASLSGGCLVSTSWAESFGLSVLEAMALGCPVIVPEVVGLRDLVTDGETGLLYPPINVGRASELVTALLGDEELRTQLAERGAERARSFTIGRAIDDLLDAFSAFASRRAEPATFALPSRRIAALAAQLAERARQSDEHKRQLAELAQREEAGRATIEALHSQLRGQQAQIQNLEIEIGQLRQRIAEREQQNQALAAVAGEMNAELQKIVNSRYWKVLTYYWRGRSAMRDAGRRLAPRSGPAVPAENGSGAGAPVELVSEPTPAYLADPALIELSARPAAPAIFCFPVIDWEFRFQRPQQLLTQFAHDGYTIIYLRTAFHQLDDEVRLTPISPGVYGLQLPGPADLNLYHHQIDQETLARGLAALDRFRREAGIVEALSLIHLPFWTPMARAARERWGWKMIYDCMDEHTGFSTNQPEMLNQEVELLRESDLVISSGRRLHEKNASLARRALLLPNATDFVHFRHPGPGRPLAALRRPIIGYYGAISEWFDVEMVRGAAAARPDWQFVLIGSTYGADVTPLEGLENVHLLGEQPYQTLPEYLQDFDVACIPFRLNSLTLATSPVKFYEYLSAGKPILSVELPEIDQFKDYYYPVHDAADFVAQAERALAEEGPEAGERRRAIARDETWRARFVLMRETIVQLYGKASIIILSYDNPQYLRLCLESIWQKTEYPRYEVIVVDNGSGPAVTEYLTREGERESRLRVILNRENLGFAAGNNIGLKAARGADYLVLLNDDTIVTRGWLSRLIRHLGDQSIGLLGPTTNHIGNEARIEVPYTEVAEVDEFARRRTKEQEGRGLELQVAAMFCVALRRNVLDWVGLLDERFRVGMFEDDDYSQRVREAGYRIICAEDVFIHHWGNTSFSKLGEPEYRRIFEENRRLYVEKWGGWNQHQSRTSQLRVLPLVMGTADPTPDPPIVDTISWRQLDQILARVRESRGAIIFLPSIGWNIDLSQRPHHLARAFAELGYMVFFDCSNANDDLLGFKELSPQLYLFRGDERTLRRIPDAILWAFTYNYHRTDNYPASSRIVYDWIDDLDVFPYDRKLLGFNHERGLKEADLVASVARRLDEMARALRPDALYLPNGVDVNHFSIEGPLPEGDTQVAELLERKRPVAGYYGALAEWFDYELLEEVATARPDWDFLLIGPDYEGSMRGRGERLLSRPNVRWIGARPYTVLPGYLRLFDVALIPFVINEITLATSPLKLYEYFAGGKPVITTPMPECMAYREVRIVRCAEELSGALDAARAQGKDPAYRSRARALAAENTWTERARAVAARLDGNHQGQFMLESVRPLDGL